MKTTLLLSALALALASCSNHDTDPTHAAVAAHLKKSMHDPDSYQEARWGQPAAYRKLTADTLLATEKMKLWQPLGNHAVSAIDSLHRPSLFRGDLGALRATSRSGMAAARRADSLLLIINNLKASKDTTRLGTLITHSFRGKNKLNAVVLDSGQFVVYKDGRVQEL